MKFIGVFLSAVLLDYVWAWYIQAAAEKQALRAAGLSAAIAVMGGALAIGYVADHLLLLPLTAGCFVGTYLKCRE